MYLPAQRKDTELYLLKSFAISMKNPLKVVIVTPVYEDKQKGFVKRYRAKKNDPDSSWTYSYNRQVVAMEKWAIHLQNKFIGIDLVRRIDSILELIEYLKTSAGHSKEYWKMISDRWCEQFITHDKMDDVQISAIKLLNSFILSENILKTMRTRAIYWMARQNIMYMTEKKISTTVCNFVSHFKNTLGNFLLKQIKTEITDARDDMMKSLLKNRKIAYDRCVNNIFPIEKIESQDAILKGLDIKRDTILLNKYGTNDIKFYISVVDVRDYNFMIGIEGVKLNTKGSYNVVVIGNGCFHGIAKFKIPKHFLDSVTYTLDFSRIVERNNDGRIPKNTYFMEIVDRNNKTVSNKHCIVVHNPYDDSNRWELKKKYSFDKDITNNPLIYNPARDEIITMVHKLLRGDTK